jgi:hypothetical protein
MLDPERTRVDIRDYLQSHPDGLSLTPSDFNEVATERGWSNSITSRYFLSGLKTLGVVKIDWSNPIDVTASLANPASK